MQVQELVAGDTLNFSTTVPGYSAAAGWVLKYRLVPRTAANSVIALTGAASGDDHLFQVGASTTANWAADTYGWSAWVEKDSEKYTVQSGQIVVKPDPRTLAAGADTRSAARRALDDARTARNAWNPTMRRYRIGDREREFNDVAEIVRLIVQLEREVEREDLLAGRPTQPARRIHTRI